MPFETPGAVERAERLAAVAAMIYLVFNEGYSASGGEADGARPAVRRGDPAGAPAAAAVPDRAGDHGADGADAAAACARARRASTPTATIVLLEDQDRAPVEPQADRRGAGADRQGDAPPPARAPTRCRRRSPPCTPAPRGREDTDWAQIDLLYATLEQLQPSPVVTLNRAVAVAKVRGPGRGAGDDRAAGDRGSPAISTSSACKGAFLLQLGRADEAQRRLRPGHRARQHRRPRPPISACISTAWQRRAELPAEKTSVAVGSCLRRSSFSRDLHSSQRRGS